MVIYQLKLSDYNIEKLAKYLNVFLEAVIFFSPVSHFSRKIKTYTTSFLKGKINHKSVQAGSKSQKIVNLKD